MPRLEATGPNQCWTWDITKLRGPVPRTWFFLYAIIDIYSRKLVGWTIAHRESETIAKALIATTCRRYGIDRDQLTIHADRGSPMIANSVADLMSAIGVTKSHSRPRVSNDNPYIEAQFKTLKYRPDFPDRFADIAATRAWMRRYEHWYNHVHYHSAIGYQRPADLHDGTHHTITKRRNEVLQRAYQHRPDRFRRPPSPPSVPTVAWINKPTIQTTSTSGNNTLTGSADHTAHPKTPSAPASNTSTNSTTKTENSSTPSSTPSSPKPALNTSPTKHPKHA